MAEKKFDFAQAYEEIEKINEWFQGEDIDLEKALQEYERGMELIKECKERLSQAENKFKEIKGRYGEGEKEGEAPEE